MSSGDAHGVDARLAPHDDAKDLACNVSFQHPVGFELGMAFGYAACHIGLGSLVRSQAADRDDVQGTVGSTVTAAIETVPCR